MRNTVRQTHTSIHLLHILILGSILGITQSCGSSTDSPNNSPTESATPKTPSTPAENPEPETESEILTDFEEPDTEIASEEEQGDVESLPYQASVLVIIAQDGQYLGVLSSSRYETEGICNPYGNYGSKYSSTSIHNQYSNYGSAYATYSAYNAYSTKPPIIFEYDGTHLYALYYLTKNTFKTPYIDPDVLIANLCN